MRRVAVSDLQRAIVRLLSRSPGLAVAEVAPALPARWRYHPGVERAVRELWALGVIDGPLDGGLAPRGGVRVCQP